MKPTILSPAILHMLLSPGRSDGKALMKYSLLDLVFRQVLTVYPDATRGADLASVMVCLGPKQEAFQATPFQAPFLALFHDIDDVVPLTEVVAFACSRSRGMGTYKRQRVAAYLHEHGWLRKSSVAALNLYWHTAEGKALKYKYQNWLEKADRLWQKFAQYPHPELGTFFRSMGAHLVLLPSFTEDSVREVLAGMDALETDHNRYALDHGRTFLQIGLDGHLFGDWLDQALALSTQKPGHTGVPELTVAA